ncbi:hypothetical protein C5C13_12660, partial [Clavibacter michiganensis]
MRGRCGSRPGPAVRVPHPRGRGIRGGQDATRSRCRAARRQPDSDACRFEGRPGPARLIPRRFGAPPRDIRPPARP